MSFLYNIDLFKLPIFLHISNRDKNSTTCGQFLSLLILFYLVFTFFNSKVFLRVHPFIVDQPQTKAHRPQISLNSENFALAFAVTDVFSKPILDPQIFKMNLFYLQLESENNTSGKNITFIDIKSTHLCNLSDFPLDPEMYTDLGLKNYTCLDNSSLELKGFWDETRLSYFTLVLSICENNTIPNLICKSLDEIKDTLKNAYFTIAYKDINYDMNDYDLPIKTLYKTEYTMIDFLIRKKITLTLKKTEILDDKNYFIEEKNIIETFKKDQTSMDIDSNSGKDTEISAFIFYPSKETQKVSRRFEKVQEACANVGGTASFTIMLFFIIIRYQNELNLTNKIMNQLYTFQPIEKKARKKKTRKEKILEKSKNNGANSYETSLEKKDISIFSCDNKRDLTFLQQKKSASLKLKEIDEGIESTKVKFQKKTIVFSMAGPDIPPKVLTDETIMNESMISPVLQEIKPKANEIFSKIELSQSKNIERLSSRLTKSISKMSNIFKRKATDLNKIKNFKDYAEALQKKENKISMGILEGIKLQLFKLMKFSMSPEQKLMIQTQKFFEEEMDFITILKRLQDIEKLKIILLNDKQLCLFNLLAKPMIYSDFSNDKKYQETPGGKLFNLLKTRQQTQENSNMEKTRSILKTYQDLQSSSELSEIDQRLMKLIDKNLENFCLHYQSKENI